MMKRVITAVVVLMGLLGGGLATAGWSAELNVIQTQKSKNAVIAIKSETGRWVQGKNSFVLEFTSPAGQLLDVGTVSLNTAMPMPGMAPMIAGATLKLDKSPGRYSGTINFADAGTRQVTVTWDGPAGKGSGRFSVPVR